MLAFLLGAYWRLAHVESALLFGDEFHSLRLAVADYRGVLTVFEPNGSGMALPLLQRVALDTWGPTHWALRAPAWIPSLLTLALIYPLGRQLVGTTAAAIATWLVAANSFLVFYGHFARSYSLVALLALILLFLAHRSVEQDDLPRKRWWGIAATTGLLPWVHLSSLLFVAPVLGATLLALGRGARPRANALRLLYAAAVGIVLASLLHAPAWRSLARFLTAKLETPYSGSFDMLDVGTLLTGSRLGAEVIALIALACAAAYFLRRRRVSWPLLAAVLGTPVLLALAHPFGDAYAYARYLAAFIAPVLLLVGWGIAQACVRLTPVTRLAEVSSLALGTGLAGLLFVLGPLGPGGDDEGPHANTYMELVSLPAFDLAWDAAPAFYRELARDPKPRRIIEVPAVTTRARHLYRNYYQSHRKSTSLGLLASELWQAPTGPYVSLRGSEVPDARSGDYLVLHHNLDREAARYWNFVYRENPGLSNDPAVAAFMNRHRRLERGTNSLPPGLRERLQGQLAAPIYEDDEIVVWSLQP